MEKPQPDILSNCVASYLNEIGPQLVSLSLCSYSPLRSLFANLDPFSSKLKCLNISAPFCDNTRTEHGALGKLIQACLGSLTELRLTFSCRFLGETDYIDIPLSSWMTSVFVDHEQTALPLTILEIYPTPHAGGWEATLALCRRSIDTLEQVIIRNVHPSIQDISSLLDVLLRCKRLRLLTVNSTKSNVHLAAKQVPHLLSLQVDYGTRYDRCVTR